MRHRGQLVGFAFAVLLAGCSGVDSGLKDRTNGAMAPYPPPARRAEIPPSPPSDDLLWLVGHWSWDGSKYAWSAGHYTRRPTPTANWRPGYWDQQGGGWLWTEGHWDS
jgi:WXXGXW repeat (2 copies)